MTRIFIWINIAAGLLLMTSYFLPYEGWDWSLYRMAQGYPVGCGQMVGPAVFFYESASSVGLGIVLIAASATMAVGRLRLANGLLLTYGGFWIVATLAYLFQFYGLMGIENPDLWMLMEVLIVAAFIILLIRLFRSTASVLKYHCITLLLGIACLLSNVFGISFCLIEDKMLLNFGAVVTAAGATTITLSAIFGIKDARINRASNNHNDPLGLPVK